MWTSSANARQEKHCQTHQECTQDRLVKRIIRIKKQIMEVGVPSNSETDTVVCGPFTFPGVVRSCPECGGSPAQLLHTIHPGTSDLSGGVVHVGVFACVKHLEHVSAFRCLVKETAIRQQDLECQQGEEIKPLFKMSAAGEDDFDIDALLAKKKATGQSKKKGNKGGKKKAKNDVVSMFQSIVVEGAKDERLELPKVAPVDAPVLGKALYLDFIPEDHLGDLSEAEFCQVHDSKVSALYNDLMTFEERCVDSEIDTNAAEAYEVSEKKYFLKFQKAMMRCTEQCLRYGLGGSPLLWFKQDHDTRRESCCGICNQPKVFLLQLMPQVLTHISISALHEEVRRQDPWSSIVVSVCPSLCWTHESVVEESVCLHHLD
eukprot:TRINITY_DN3621_c0_g1_i1.p1 TRINITY_DN3621_c0_g1~~TRINITY_DN3621_c0_g1_i1.p1  ORF type:complete len:374 (+),score=59.65 TRINITY_DN3621_c0_g1_i1:563-1684(+)